MVGPTNYRSRRPRFAVAASALLFEGCDEPSTVLALTLWRCRRRPLEVGRARCQRWRRRCAVRGQRLRPPNRQRTPLVDDHDLELTFGILGAQNLLVELSHAGFGNGAEKRPSFGEPPLGHVLG